LLKTRGHQIKPIARLPEWPAASGYPEGQYEATSEHDGMEIAAQGGSLAGEYGRVFNQCEYGTG
jgi:hypothetical protein